MTTKDVTIIHAVGNLGRFLNPSVKSVEASIAKARADLGISTQWILLANNPDESTKEYLQHHLPEEAELLITNCPSLASSKKQALEKAEGLFVSLSGGDDLLAGNWIGSAYRESSREPGAVFHPATVIVFGERCFLYIVPDQEHPDFSKDVLLLRNPWPGIAFAPKEIFVQQPFRDADEQKGFGHSDWLWVCDTVANGMVHKPVAQTFVCCHHRRGHICVTSEQDSSLLIPQSKFFQLLGKVGGSQI